MKYIGTYLLTIVVNLSLVWPTYRRLTHTCAKRCVEYLPKLTYCSRITTHVTITTRLGYYLRRRTGYFLTAIGLRLLRDIIIIIIIIIIKRQRAEATNMS